ncbi:MAG: deoxyribose-phosphate aldolase [Candidatus Acidoferrales bacterium]
MTERQMEALIEAVTREVFCYLGDRQLCELRGLEIDDLICPGCDQRCVETCADKARKVLAAGAARLTTGPGISQVPADVAGMIDHTLLKPEASREAIRKLCQEAKEFGFATVVINPAWVSTAAAALRGTRVKVCTVVGFPLGATLPQAKIYETEEVVKLGAQEVDMVLNVGALKSGEDELVEQDIRGVVEAAARGGALTKVIIEAALLTDEEKVRACHRAQVAGADFVKTSTGFGPGGATAHDVELMRLVVGPGMGVKAAGGIRNYDDLQKMITAGATRIGASASVRILEQAAGLAEAGAVAEAAPVAARY